MCLKEGEEASTISTPMQVIEVPERATRHFCELISLRMQARPSPLRALHRWQQDAPPASGSLQQAGRGGAPERRVRARERLDFARTQDQVAQSERELLEALNRDRSRERAYIEALHAQQLDTALMESEQQSAARAPPDRQNENGDEGALPTPLRPHGTASSTSEDGREVGADGGRAAPASTSQVLLQQGATSSTATLF
jgi:hypothetical protein